MMAGAAYRADQAMRVAMVTAWTTAALSRQKTLPKLSKMLGEKPATNEPQSVAQQAGLLRLMHARLGGTLIVGGKEARA